METTQHKICRLIRYYERMVGSRNPVKIAEYANIRIAILPLGKIAGNYKLINRKRWIFINENIPKDSPLFNVVIAHELGHALLHRKENCAFLKNKTLLLTSGIEKEANLFAAYLLISDEMISEDRECTIEYPKELVELRLK